MKSRKDLIKFKGMWRCQGCVDLQVMKLLWFIFAKKLLYKVSLYGEMVDVVLTVFRCSGTHITLSRLLGITILSGTSQILLCPRKLVWFMVSMSPWPLPLSNEFYIVFSLFSLFSYLFILYFSCYIKLFRYRKKNFE